MGCEDYVLRAFRVVLVVGLLIMFGSCVVGPTESAARVRSGWDTLLGRAGATASDRQAGPIAKAAAANERGLLNGTAILGGLVLVVCTRPTNATPNRCLDPDRSVGRGGGGVDHDQVVPPELFEERGRGTGQVAQTPLIVELFDDPPGVGVDKEHQIPIDVGLVDQHRGDPRR